MKEDIREIYVALGKILAYTEILEKNTKALAEEKENYYNDTIINFYSKGGNNE